MTIIKFPDLDSADEDGLLAVGGDLEIDSLLLAYQQGIFPWPYNERQLTWFAPPRRAVLFFDKFHFSKSLLREKNKKWASFAVDKNFSSVITECQKLINRKEQAGTWITKSLHSAYIKLHSKGHAHSFECYKDDILVGGLYGVSIGSMFAAESMFYRYPNASKLVLWFAKEYLEFHGLKWMDIQVMTPTLQKFGAVEVSRSEFSSMLSETVSSGIDIFSEFNISNAIKNISPKWGTFV